MFMADENTEPVELAETYCRFLKILEHKNIEPLGFKKDRNIKSQNWNNWRTRGIPDTLIFQFAREFDVFAEWIKSGDPAFAPGWLYEPNQHPSPPEAVKELAIVQKRGKIPVICFDHAEITTLLNSPNQYTGEFMKTFVECGEKSFAVVLDERHRSLDRPGTMIVFDPDEKPTLDRDCFVLVSFPNDPDHYEIMKYSKHAGDLCLENLSGRVQPISIKLTGAIVHARAVTRIGKM